MLLDRKGHCIIAIGDSIYVLGGYDGENDDLYNEVERYVKEEHK